MGRGHLVCKVNSTAGRPILTKISGIQYPETENEPEDFYPDDQDFLSMVWADTSLPLTPFEEGFFAEECYEICMEDGVFEPLTVIETDEDVYLGSHLSDDEPGPDERYLI